MDLRVSTRTYPQVHRSTRDDAAPGLLHLRAQPALARLPLYGSTGARAHSSASDAQLRPFTSESAVSRT